VSRTVLPSLDDEDGSLSVGKALNSVYRWLDFCDRFSVFVDERSKCGEY